MGLIDPSSLFGKLLSGGATHFVFVLTFFFFVKLIFFFATTMLRLLMSLIVTGRQGFRPGTTQTGLYSHRTWQEA